MNSSDLANGTIRRAGQRVVRSGRGRAPGESAGKEVVEAAVVV